MSQLTLRNVENAFQPAKEISDATRFAGRSDQVSEAYLALLSAGTNIAVVGNRGIGKTSLARQISNIAGGKTELLDRLEIENDEVPDFLTLYFACGTSTNNINELIQRLLTTHTCLADWIYDVPAAKEEILSFSPEIGGKLFGIGASVSGEKSTSKTSSSATTTHTLDTVFTNVCHAIAKEGLAQDGLLIIIDEFDQIIDPSGMAGLMKSMATNVPNVMFCLIGVATDIRRLMKEHESTDRLFAGSIINLAPMDDNELTEIVRIAEKSIGSEIVFSDDATTELVKTSRGHPYMVHLVGKYALRIAYKDNVKTITKEGIRNALSSIAERRADPVLEGRYKKAVGSSPQRESVLRALAAVRSEDGECWTTDAYKIALDDGVDNSSQYVGQLGSTEYGGEIEKTRERFYRFKDSLFATYVLARPRQFDEKLTVHSSGRA